MGMGDQRHVPATLLPESDPVPIVEQASGPEGRSALLRKMLPLPGFDPRTIQPEASRSTVWFTQAVFPNLIFNECYCWLRDSALLKSHLLAVKNTYGERKLNCNPLE